MVFNFVSHASNFFVAVHRVLDQVFERFRLFHILQNVISYFADIYRGRAHDPVGPVPGVTDTVNQARAVPLANAGRHGAMLIICSRVRHQDQQFRIGVVGSCGALNLCIGRVA